MFVTIFTCLPEFSRDFDELLCWFIMFSGKRTEDDGIVVEWEIDTVVGTKMD